MKHEIRKMNERPPESVFEWRKDARELNKLREGLRHHGLNGVGLDHLFRSRYGGVCYGSDELLVAYRRW